jgi:hypothetical protein
MAWVAKGSRGLQLLILHAFYRQRVLVTSQQVHAATILMWQAIITGEGSYRLFFSVPPLSFSNMLLMIMRSIVWLFLTPLTCPPCWSFLFSGLDMGPFLLFLVFPLFWVLCLNKVWHGLVTWLNRVHQGTYPNETRKNPWSQTSNRKAALHIS